MKLSELKEDFDWLKIIFDAHAKFMSEEGMVLVPRESYDIVLCKSIRALSDAIQQIEQREEENEVLRQWLNVVLDCADYTAGNCGVTEMVGAVLPKEVIEQARDALAETLENGR